MSHVTCHFPECLSLKRWTFSSLVHSGTDPFVFIIERKGTNWWVHFAVKPSGNGRYLSVINKTK